jgi:hypothetical protein
MGVLAAVALVQLASVGLLWVFSRPLR